MLELFAACAPGVEPFAAEELTALGLPSVRTVDGGVEFTGRLREVYRANLHLRTVSRLLVRLGGFHAAEFWELHKKTARLPWDEYLAAGRPVAVRATCRKSKLYHSGAVAERVRRAIAERLGQAPPAQAADDDADDPPQLILVRLDHDECTLSLDSSGSLLHRRGYRLAAGKAPLRETLAAAMLLASGWDAAAPLLDPFCGAGTIAIEAALLAAGRRPGAERQFAFMHWPSFDRRLWKAVHAERPAAGARPVVLASDRDQGAVDAALANAERAGVADRINFSRRAVSSIEPPPGPGWIVTNPPYGARVADNRDLRNLYARLGDSLRERCPGWRVALLTADPALARQTRLQFDSHLPMVNGGIKVALWLGAVG